MPQRYLLLALNGPVDDAAEPEYNRWYDEIHVPDIQAIPGVVSAQRYKIVGGKMPEGANWPYVAAYEIETDDLQGVMMRMNSEPRPFTEAFDRSRSGSVLAVALPASGSEGSAG